MTTIETEKGAIIENIVEKFASLLALADSQEVEALDSALAKVMPALPNEYLDFKIGLMHTENNNVECGIALFIRPVAKNNTQYNISEKWEAIVINAKEEDIDLLNAVLDAILECSPQRIEIGVLPVMEIVPNTWGFHFSINTLN